MSFVGGRTWKPFVMRLVAVAGLLSLIGAAQAEASSLALRLGRFSPTYDSELWADNFGTFTIEDADFRGIIGGIELGVELSEFVDLTFGVDASRRTVFSSYRDFVRDDGSEVFQDLRMDVTPVTAGVKFLPLGKFRRVSPYVGGGFGLYVYEYQEEGEFIDFDTFDVFTDFFVDQGVGTGAYATVGLQVALNPGVRIFGEYRRHWASWDHRDDFEGFGKLDLNADQVSFGVSFQF